MNDDLQKMEKEVVEYFKDAFIVDGDVKILKGQTQNFIISSVIELNDSERGTFYLGKLSRIN